MEVKVMSQNVRPSGNKIIITKQQEEIYTLEELDNIKTSIIRERKQIINQMNILKTRYDETFARMAEVDDMINQLSQVDEELPEIPTE
jgi:hypothetical protein